MGKVVVDARSIVPSMDGLGIYSVFLLRRLVAAIANDTQCTVVLPNSLADASVLGPEVLDRVDVVRTHMEKFGGDYSDDLEEWDRFIAAMRPDVYVSTAFFGTRHSCARAVVVPDIIPVALPQYYPEEKVAFYQKALDITMYNTELIVTLSEFSRTDIQRFYGRIAGEMLVVYPDIFAVLRRIEGEHVNRVNERPFFLVIGVKEPRKNVDLVLRAVNTMRDGTLSFDVFIVGKHSPSMVPILAMIEEMGLQDVVKAPGYVSDDELVGLMHGCSGLIYPSSYEGFGMPVVEALCAHKPVICLAESSIPEIGGDVVTYFDGGDESLARVMLDVLSGEISVPRESVDAHLRYLVSKNEAQVERFMRWLVQML